MSDSDIPAADITPGCPHPRLATTLYGQQAAEAAFLDSWRAGRLHHAWLLTGAKGIGKATLAYRLARALIADSLPPVDLATPPDCPVARRIAAGSEPRLRVLTRIPDPKIKNPTRNRTVIAVDQARDLGGFFALSIPDGGRRVAIVDAIDEANPQTANALLKILEEPPADTVFLLICHGLSGVLPTIRSRCRRLDLAPLGPADLAAALSGAGLVVPDQAADALAALAGGSASAAARLLASEGIALYDRLCALLAPTGTTVDRARLMALAESAAGRAAEERYALILDLGLLLATRLARAAAGLPTPPATEAEGRLTQAARAQGRLAALTWAEAAEDMATRAATARAGNLDPARTVIDTWLTLSDRLAALEQGMGLGHPTPA
ncbi:MAG: DNA polymerase III subunit delta' [Pseudomonadota bacterium]